jgi:hypothetical protein
VQLAVGTVARTQIAVVANEATDPNTVSRG